MRSTALASVLACLLSGAAPVSGATTGVAPRLPSSDVAALAAKQIVRYQPVTYTAADLAAIRAAGEAGGVVTLPGRGYVVRISPTLVVDSGDELIRPYHGEVVGHPGSSVRLTVNLRQKSLHGTVRLPADGLHFVEPVRDGGATHVWYRNEDALIDPRAVVRPVAVGYTVPSPLPGNASADIAAGGPATYKLAYVRLYRDNSTWDLTPIMNSVDDIYTKSGSVGIRLQSVTSVTTINTDTYGDGKDCSLLTSFWTNHPITGTGHSRADKALLFTNNSNIDYGNLLGCGSGEHAWARWSGSTKQKVWAAAHELGHTFGAGHDDTVYRTHCTTTCHPHYSLMNGGFGEEDRDLEFSSTSKSQIASGWTQRYNTQIFSGADVSAQNVQLNWWEVRYPRVPTVAAGDFRLQRQWRANSGTVSLLNQFVGARSCSTETCNRDFGHSGPYTLGVHSAGYVYNPPVAGTWRFWPAYQHSGGWGPFEWKKVTVTVS